MYFEDYVHALAKYVRATILSSRPPITFSSLFGGIHQIHQHQPGALEHRRVPPCSCSARGLRVVLLRRSSNLPVGKSSGTSRLSAPSDISPHRLRTWAQKNNTYVYDGGERSMPWRGCIIGKARVPSKCTWNIVCRCRSLLSGGSVRRKFCDCLVADEGC